MPDLSIKDAIKNLLNDKLELKIERKFDVDEGMMISINYSIENENEILNLLEKVQPDLMEERNKQK